MSNHQEHINCDQDCQETTISSDDRAQQVFDAFAKNVIKDCGIQFSYDKTGNVSNAILSKSNFDKLLTVFYAAAEDSQLLRSLMKEATEKAETQKQQE